MKRLIIITLMFFLSVFSANAVLNDAKIYYSFDTGNVSGTNLYDISGNQFNGTCTLTPANPCNVTSDAVLNQAMFFDGNGDYVTMPPNAINTSEFTLNFWFESGNTGRAHVFATKGGTGTPGSSVHFTAYISAADTLSVEIGNGATKEVENFLNAGVNDGSYHLVTIQYSDSLSKVVLYVDGFHVQNLTNTISMNTGNATTYLSRWGALSSSFDLLGNLDEFSIYDRLLQPNEISDYYNQTKNPYVPTGEITFDTITVNNETLVNNSFFNSTDLNFIINTSVSETSNQTNLSFYLYNSTNDLINFNQFANNSLDGDFILNLTNTTYKIWFRSVNNETSTDTINYTFSLDNTIPTITNNIPTTINSFTLNITNSSCSDENLDSCILSINSQNINLNDINFVNITQAGNHSYTITANDTAGNTVNETGLIFVNPNVTISFEYEGTPVTNYTYGSRSDGDTGVVEFKYFNDVLIIGQNNLTFSKVGYIQQVFSFNLTNSSPALNLTFNVTPAQININVYDRETLAFITDNVSLELVGNVGNTTTTTTGQAVMRVINGTPGDYQIIATSNNYETETIYFTYTNQENLTVNIYMLNATGLNTGVININVKNSFSEFVQSALVEALEWKSNQSAYVSIAQCQTNVNGQCSLNIELNNKLYKFRATKDGVTKTTNSQIITTTGQTLTIILETGGLDESTDLSGLSYSFTDTVNNNVSLARFEWLDTALKTTQACIKTYRVSSFNRVFLSQNCTSASSGILFKSSDINQTYAVSIEAYVTSQGTEYLLATIKYPGTNDIGELLRENNLDIYVPMIFALIALGVGVFFGNIYITAMLLIILEWFAVLIVPSAISSSIAVVITVLSGLIMWGANRK